MGDYSMAARYAFLLTIGPPLHEDGPCGRTPCQPIVYALCSRCERRFEWCTAGPDTVRAICAETWICAGCLEGVTP